MRLSEAVSSGPEAEREAALVAARDHAVLAAALDPILTIDAYGTILSASDSVERVFGWRPSELSGRNINVLMPEPYHSAHDGYLESYRRTGRTNIMGRTREFECVRRDGERFPIELSVSRVDPPGGGLPVFVGLIRDITERKRLERELRLMQDLALSIGGAERPREALRETLRLICTATEWDYGELWLPDASGDELVGVESWVRAGSGLEGFASTMGQTRFVRGWGLAGRAWATGRPVWAGDVSALRESEFCRPAAAREAGLRAAAAVPILSEGEAIAVLLFFVGRTRREDVHLLEQVRTAVAPLGSLIERKRAQEALQESEQRLRWALRAANGSAWDWDLERDEAWWSEEMYELWGVAPGTPMRSENSLALIHEADRARVRREVESAVGQGCDYRCEFRIAHPTRGERWMVSHARVVHGESGRPARLLGISLDITDRKLAEAELERHRERLEELVAQRTTELNDSQDRLRLADRLASIGALAAGLGHDMNNVLLPVRAHLNALRASGVSDAARAHVESITRSVSYLQQLADGLHFLAMDPEAEEDVRGGGNTTDLGQWWAQAGVLIAKAVPRHVDVEAQIPGGLAEVAVAAHRLTQAVLNLVVNAGEAIPAERPTRGRVLVWARADGAHVRVGVTDNGKGMTEEVQRRAFEMFFTSKPRGLGTGLGLALVNKVATGAGGRVEVESTLGKGATVVMVLPAAPERAGVGEAPVAVVTVGDGRCAAMIAQILGAAGATVGGEAPDRADVWVADPSEVGLVEARAWREARPHARLVLFGAPEGADAPGWRALGPITIESRDDFERLRSGLGEAVSAR